jgi:hypothetical protein
MHLSCCGIRSKNFFKNFGFGPKTLALKWITTVFVQNLSRYNQRGYGKNGRENVTVLFVSAYILRFYHEEFLTRIYEDKHGNC